jgi:hypothetical protein
MRHHLTSLNKSIWDVIEIEMQVPQVGHEDYDSDEVAQIKHFNSQATTILLASLCREEYNKLQGLKSTKEIWDVLKAAHEGDMLAKITKMEVIKGDLGRFTLNKGEEPQEMYNRLKTMLNKVRNLRSTKWTNHNVNKLMLRSLVFCNGTLVQLLRENHRYKLTTHEEVLGKFVSFKLMAKDSKHVNNIAHGNLSIIESQPIAFKAIEEKEETIPSKRLPIEPSKLDNEEMALIIKSFRQILKQRKVKNYMPHSKRVFYRCGKFGHYNAKCSNASDDGRDDNKKGKNRMEKKKFFHKKKGREAQVKREWDSDESSSDKDIANIDINNGILFPQRRPQVPHGQGEQKQGTT